ncbi:MAG: hypothetical protein AB7V46_24615, partial [Thermomicrobiales bacterium]
RAGDDPQLADEAAIDALLSYAERPEQYDPEKLELERYLRMAARGDLSNLRSKESRRRNRLVPLSDVEPWDQGGNNQSRNEPSNVSHLRGLEQLATSHARNGPEELVLNLMLDGERRTEIYARALGITEEEPAVQRKIVKSTKDRLKKRLERSRWGHGGQ